MSLSAPTFGAASGILNATANTSAVTSSLGSGRALPSSGGGCTTRSRHRKTYTTAGTAASAKNSGVPRGAWETASAINAASVANPPRTITPRKGPPTKRYLPTDPVSGSMCAVRTLLAMVFVLCSAGVVLAQAQAPASQPAPAAEPVTWKDRLKEPDQAGGMHFSEHWGVAFGGIKQGSGVALGPAWSTKFSDGGFLQLKGVGSIKKFWIVQARYDTQRFWSDSAILITRLRHYNAPELSLYHRGPLSPDARAEYSERRTDASTLLVMRPFAAARVSLGFGVERYATGADPIPVKEGPGALPELPPEFPGVGTHPWFAHSYGSFGWDTRLSPDYSRSGHFAEIGLHDYHDVKNGQDSFRRAETTLQQLVPVYGGKGVIDAALGPWFTFGKNEGSVPFFLMPTLGGGDLLRAFPSYRFRDRNAWLFKGEFRWAVHEMADIAGLYEGGKVGPAIENLDFRDMAHSVAVGIRVHNKTSSLFRADVAHGRDGWGFRVGFSAGGS